MPFMVRHNTSGPNATKLPGETRKDKDEKDTRPRKEDRRNYKLEKIRELTKKFYAVATKRKWLVIMMGLGITIYFIMTSGGGFSFMGILDKLKGLVGM